MILPFRQKLAIALLPILRFANPFLRELAALDVLERRRHALCDRAIDDLRANGEITPLRRGRNARTHSGDASFMNEIDDEFQFVQTFEVGQLGRVARTRTSVSKPKRTSAFTPPQSTACSPKRSVSVSSPKVVSMTPARVQPMPFAQASAVFFARRLGFCQTATSPGTPRPFTIPAHHGPKALRRDHDNIHVFRRNNRAVEDGEAVREEERVAGAQMRRDGSLVNGRHLGIG